MVDELSQNWLYEPVASELHRFLLIVIDRQNELFLCHYSTYHGCGNAEQTDNWREIQKQTNQPNQNWLTTTANCSVIWESQRFDALW